MNNRVLAAGGQQRHGIGVDERPPARAVSASQPADQAVRRGVAGAGAAGGRPADRGRWDGGRVGAAAISHRPQWTALVVPAVLALGGCAGTANPAPPPAPSMSSRAAPAASENVIVFATLNKPGG
jgi:hypothetical protein